MSVSLMSVSLQPRRAFNNQLLDALSTVEYQHLAPHLERVALSLGEVLYRADQPIRYVYFPENAVISMLSTMEDGSTVEVGLVGSEGMLGIRLLLGTRTTPHSANVQVAGTALRMGAETFDKELRLGSPLQALLLRYTQAMLTQIRQSSACNTHHSIKQRFSRWLLTIQDYTRSDNLLLTHELIAMMIGARRAGITAVAGGFQEMGLISYTRGHITILDRQGLEQAACECYWVVREEFNGLYENQQRPATRNARRC